MQYHEYIRQNERKPAAQSYRACKMAASCTFQHRLRLFMGAGGVFLLGAFENMGIENITKERKCLYANKENAAGQRAFGVGNAVCHDARRGVCG